MSNYKIVKVTREELYRMVWSKPVTKWAAEFGLSDVGFAKICKKMKVPVPRRGYWAMIKKGIKPALPGLKSVHDPNNMVIEIKKRLPKLNSKKIRHGTETRTISKAITAAHHDASDAAVHQAVAAELDGDGAACRAIDARKSLS